MKILFSLTFSFPQKKVKTFFFYCPNTVYPMTFLSWVFFFFLWLFFWSLDLLSSWKKNDDAHNPNNNNNENLLLHQLPVSDMLKVLLFYDGISPITTWLVWRKTPDKGWLVFIWSWHENFNESFSLFSFSALNLSTDLHMFCFLSFLMFVTS